jgi:hypothetical protein
LPCKGDLFRFTLSLTSTSRLIAGEKGEGLFLHEQVVVFDADRPVRGETSNRKPWSPWTGARSETIFKADADVAAPLYTVDGDGHF